MIRLVLSALLVSALAGCSTMTRVLRWKPDDGTLVVSADLVGGSPSEIQKRQVDAIIHEKCGDTFKIVEEGTDFKSSPYFSMIGNVASAGETTSAAYYWIVRCGQAASS